MTVSQYMYVGYCPVSATGSVLIAGGSLFVTNAAGTAVLDLSGGTLTLNSGLMIVDKIVITNTCARFVITGGTFYYGQFEISSSLDADGDGLPNWWEVPNGIDPLDPLGANGANGDPDGDGLSNMQEFLAGTSPTNSASRFAITGITRESNNIRITWMTHGGRTNQVQASTYTNGRFSTNFVNVSPAIIIPGTNDATTTYLDVGAVTNAAPLSYRVRLVP